MDRLDHERASGRERGVAEKGGGGMGILTTDLVVVTIRLAAIGAGALRLVAEEAGAVRGKMAVPARALCSLVGRHVAQAEVDGTERRVARQAGTVHCRGGRSRQVGASTGRGEFSPSGLRPLSASSNHCAERVVPGSHGHIQGPPPLCAASAGPTGHADAEHPFAFKPSPPAPPHVRFLVAAPARTLPVSLLPPPEPALGPTVLHLKASVGPITVLMSSVLGAQL